MHKLVFFPVLLVAACVAAAIRRHWLAAGRQKTSKLIGPALVDVVGRKGVRGKG